LICPLNMGGYNGKITISSTGSNIAVNMVFLWNY
jgi:hypothetical protein